MKNFLHCTFASIFCFCLTLPAYADWQPESKIGGNLNTRLYIPSSPPLLANKRALMLSLHGCKQDNELFKLGSQWPSAAEKYGMIVALPESSGEGPYGSVGCWNFMDGINMSRKNSDAKYLLNLVEALVKDPQLNIDPNQVYITGISSGGAISASLGCLAPDVFAGIGTSGAPGPGSDGKAIAKVDFTIAQGSNNCKILAQKENSKNLPSLHTQLHSTICGTADDRVDPNWCIRLSEIMAATYAEGASIKECSGGNNPTTLTGGGTVSTFCDATGPRVSTISVDGMGHAWASGPGSSGGGINFDYERVNYQTYVTEFFFRNNRRVKR